MTERTPSVFVVGTGPVATAIAGALRHGGVPVLGLWGRRPEAVRKAAGTAGVAGFGVPPDLILEADVLLLAVKDDAIRDVAAQLLETGLVTRKHVLLHCSGALAAAEAFGGDGAAIGVAGVGTLHPLRSFPDVKDAARSLKGTVFGLEGDEVGKHVAHRLCRALGGTPLDIHGEGMALYHAAAALAANALVALFDAAAEALAAAGIPREEAPAALLPLMRGTLENVARVGTPEALTGPIGRGDAGTIAKHLTALSAQAPGLVTLYQALSRRVLDVARKKGVAPPENLAKIAQLLGE
jgi:predicted short-subunit dehydrogenase-like oxidoreductase (DUF2520 family)